jgi:nucleoside 2-deoxyribosyltransferase
MAELTKVYLAGGFARKGKTDWRNKVYKAIPTYNVKFYDPYLKSGDKDRDILSIGMNYWGWDIFKIHQSDIVFCYFQKGNPGIGTFIELGYAGGLGKHIIVVMENGNGKEVIPDRYRNDTKWFADASFDNLKDGIKYLKTLIL